MCANPCVGKLGQRGEFSLNKGRRVLRGCEIGPGPTDKPSGLEAHRGLPGKTRLWPEIEPFASVWRKVPLAGCDLALTQLLDFGTDTGLVQGLVMVMERDLVLILYRSR